MSEWTDPVATRWVEVEPDYVCPLCPDHKDDIFIFNAILRVPICQGCNYELWNDVYGHESRPESMLLDRLEKLTSLKYEEYCLIEVESVIDDHMQYVSVDREHLSELVAEADRLKSIIRAGKGKEKVECTIFLNVDVDEWTYSRELRAAGGGNATHARILSLNGEVEYPGFIDRMRLHCLVTCGPNSINELAATFGNLDLHEQMEEVGLPAHASIDVVVGENEFNDLKECLAQSMDYEHSRARISFELRGLQKDPTEKVNGEWKVNDTIERIEGRPLEVTGFCWELQCHAP